jgi:hypothetical protein
MTENRFETALKTMLEDQSIGEEIGEPNLLARSVATFAERGVLTRNAGLVVRLQDGSEFQITIVQSQQADLEDDGEPVDEAAACPNCGERDVDKLVWLNVEDEQVQCAACGMVYRPDTK